MTASRLSLSLKRFQRWFTDDAMPLWVARGYDKARGGFYETLDFSGAPVDGQPRRVRVQARQIYTFSHAALRGWRDGAEALAAEGFEYFLARACPDGGARGCVHLLSDDGDIIDNRRDLYDQAFLLLACAARWRAAKDGRALDLADRTIAFMDHELASPHGGWLESDRRETPRRQNPHMHLFEAFLALLDATGDDRFRQRAEQVFALFQSVFHDRDRGVVWEFFNDGWDRAGQPETIEPGHMFEWVWLLNKYEQATGADYEDMREALFSRTAALASDAAHHGFVANRVSLDGREQTKDKRLWPQTEYLKACLVQFRRGDAAAGERARSLIEALFETYLNTQTPGLWTDEYDGAGAPAARDVPASILYHLFEAVAETAETAKTVDA